MNIIDITKERFDELSKQLDKDCPLHDCDKYNTSLRGGCFIGSKRKNCRMYKKKTEEVFLVWNEKCGIFIEEIRPIHNKLDK
jgi:hypothetical protein